MTVSPPPVRPTSILFNPATEPETQRTYVVFGTRRGGTSMVAGAVRALGLDLGNVGGRRNNEDPQFQNRSMDDIRAAIERRDAARDVWGWKFPAAANYLPAIISSIRNPYFIVVYRDPVAAALSQANKDQRARQRTPRIALHECNSNANMNTGFILATDRPCLLVSHERALGDTGVLIDELADFLSLERPGDSVRSRMLDYLAPGHYKSFSDFFASEDNQPS